MKDEISRNKHLIEISLRSLLQMESKTVSGEGKQWHCASQSRHQKASIKDECRAAPSISEGGASSNFTSGRAENMGNLPCYD